MKITRREVAKMAGVSPTTVSDVLNETPHARINKDTRRKVLRAAKELDYQPNFLARSLVLQKSFNIGIVVCAGNDNLSLSKTPSTIGVLQGVQDALEGFDYYISYLSVFNLHNFDYKAVFKTRRVDGLIIIQTLFSDLELLEADAKIKQYPLIIVSNHLPGAGLNYVDVDNENGIFQAMAHLVRLGYRKIGFVGGHLNQSDFVERRNAYKTALEKYRLAADPAIVIETLQENYDRMVQNWISGRKCPEAVIAANDVIAMDMIKALRKAGLAVPGDMGVVGFDDMETSSYFQPPLTTIRQPLHEIGVTAAKELINIIDNKDVRKQVKRILPPELIVRESCGAGIRGDSVNPGEVRTAQNKGREV